jgi:predicted metal-dependent peptidase
MTDMPLEDLLNGKAEGGSFDDHSFWDGISEEQRDMVEGRIRDIVEKAVREADSRSDGWGDIPAHMRDSIRKSVSKIINWRSVLRQFAGTLVRGRRRTSIKRINRRFPYIHPGVTKGYMARLCICIDQSGSVDEGMLQMFFAELRTLNKNIEIDILPFDCDCDVDDVYTWKRGQCPAAKRTRMGGTDFSAPTRVMNDPKNRGRWDGYLIMTDGMAPAPGPSRLKRGWVLGKGCKMDFNTSDIVIELDDGKVKHGVWH